MRQLEQPSEVETLQQIQCLHWRTVTLATSVLWQLRENAASALAAPAQVRFFAALQHDFPEPDIQSRETG
jgi:hypothetical protein